MKRVVLALCILQAALVVRVLAGQDAQDSVEKHKITVRVTKVKRVKNGCIASVESDKIRYEISSDRAGACTMLRAGEDYRAFPAITSPMDEAVDDYSGDVAVLVVYSNVKGSSLAAYNFVFEIESQEVLKKPTRK
jgi:hypothetical protein